MSALDLRPKLLARKLTAAGLPADQAAECVAWVQLMPSNATRLAAVRDALRHLGQQHRAMQLLADTDMLAPDCCAHCGRAIRMRACRVVLHAQVYCTPQHAIESLEKRA